MQNGGPPLVQQFIGERKPIFRHSYWMTCRRLESKYNLVKFPRPPTSSEFYYILPVDTPTHRIDDLALVAQLAMFGLDIGWCGITTRWAAHIQRRDHSIGRIRSERHCMTCTGSETLSQATAQIGFDAHRASFGRWGV